MVYRKAQDFTMYHDIVDGVATGWTVAFTIHYTVNRGTKCEVWAKSPTGRTLRSRKDVAKIFPMEDWPPFALIDSLDQKVESVQDERLF